jgi:hypothetical protein
VSADAPDLAGFKAAQDLKRTAFGEPIRFLWPADRTYAPDVALNASGEPLDPTVAPTAVDQPEATITATVATRTTLASDARRSEQTPIGRLEKGTMQLNVAIEDAPTIAGAESLGRRGGGFEIIDTRAGGLGPEPNRYLVTGRLTT